MDEYIGELDEEGESGEEEKERLEQTYEFLDDVIESLDIRDDDNLININIRLNECISSFNQAMIAER